MKSPTFSFFFSSRRRHTRCALVTGVQTCALPISRRCEAVDEGLHALGARPVVLTEDDPLQRTRLADHARANDRRCDISHPAQHRLIPKARFQDQILDDAVLKRKKRRFLVNERCNQVNRSGSVRQLDRKQDKICPADGRRIIGCRDGRSADTSVTQVLYAETMLTNGVQMPAARDEHDVMTGFGQLRSVETTDTASPHHCNSHLPSSAPHIYKQARSSPSNDQSSNGRLGYPG